MDRDIREALEASIRTYRSLQSGLYYETRPDNPLAARIGDTLQERIAEFRKEETQKLGMTRTRDSDVLRLLVFFQRLALDRDNGRPRGRAFVDVLRAFYPDGSAPAAPRASSLILP